MTVTDQSMKEKRETSSQTEKKRNSDSANLRNGEAENEGRQWLPSLPSLKEGRQSQPCGAVRKAKENGYSPVMVKMAGKSQISHQ